MASERSSQAVRATHDVVLANGECELAASVIADGRALVSELPAVLPAHSHFLVSVVASITEALEELLASGGSSHTGQPADHSCMGHDLSNPDTPGSTQRTDAIRSVTKMLPLSTSLVAVERRCAVLPISAFDNSYSSDGSRWDAAMRPARCRGGLVQSQASSASASPLQGILHGVQQQYHALKQVAADMSRYNSVDGACPMPIGSSAQERLEKVKHVLAMLWTALLSARSPRQAGKGEVDPDAENAASYDTAEVPRHLQPHLQRLQSVMRAAKRWVSCPTLQRVSCPVRGTNTDQLNRALSSLLLCGGGPESPAPAAPHGDSRGVRSPAPHDEVVLRNTAQQLQLRCVDPAMRMQRAECLRGIRAVQKAVTELASVLTVDDADVIEYEDIKYRSTDVLGEGSFGRVYSGSLYFAPVAIKELRPPNGSLDDDWAGAESGASDRGSCWARTTSAPPVIRDLLKEVRTLKSLHHPNVVLFRGICFKPPLLITELCELGSLRHVIDQFRAACEPRSGRLWCNKLPQEHRTVICDAMSWRGRVAIALDAAKGMAYLCKRGVLHRDLKSPNLLLDKHGVCKVADFGFAKRVSAAPPQSQRGGPVCAVNNPLWQAPELLQGNEEATPASDVYSFGQVLWELLMLQRPWPDLHGKHIASLSYRVRELGERPQVPEGLVGVPEGGACGLAAPSAAAAALPMVGEFADLMRHCWAQAPESRPCFYEVVEALEGIREGVSRADAGLL